MPEPLVFRPWLLLLSLLLTARVVTAQDTLSIDMHVANAAVSVGDRITVTVHYRWPANWTVDPDPRPAPVFDRAGLFLTDLPPVERVSDAQWEQRIWHIGILITRSGAWALPRPGLQATATDGSVHTVSAPELILQVDLDAEAQARLPEPSPLWQPRADGGAPPSTHWPWFIVAAVAIAFAVILLTRRRQPLTLVTPSERFTRDLRLLASSHDGKHASHLLSQALRRYAGSIFAFDGLGATAAELRRLSQDRIPEDERLQLLNLLERLDAQRFAPADFDAERIGPLLEEAQAWVTACDQQHATNADSERPEKTTP